MPRRIATLYAENWIVQDNLTMLRQLGIIIDDERTIAGTPTVSTPTLSPLRRLHVSRLG